METLILGGGVGGLTLALCLHRAGIPCRVYEAAPEIRQVGVGVNILPHASAELAALGVRTPTRAQVEDEMTHQCATLAATLPPAGDREAQLRQAVMRALNDYETDP